MGTGYCLGEWTVRPHRNQIERGNEIVHLAPKAMAVLDCLARAANSVVTRQDIFDSVWLGAVVSDETLTQRISELRKVFEDSAQQPKIIETIPKVGFRLIPPVIPLSEKPAADQGFSQATGSKKALKRLAFIIPGLLIIALVMSHFWPDNPVIQDLPINAENPVIAVLPFVNISEDAGNDYFSDGISEELINLLAKVPGLDIISRTSSFHFKGKDLKIADIAKELNASQIVEGSVRKIDNRVRITAQLIDPVTDSHLWTNSYDREFSDIFSLQEEIAQSIVTAMQDEIGPHTVIVERPTDDIEAYDLFWQGRNLFYQRGPALDSAIVLLQMAVKKDPEFAEAWAYLAGAAFVVTFYQTSISNEKAWMIAEHAARTSLDLNPGLGRALAVQAMLAYAQKDLKRGFQIIDLAADRHPNDVLVRLWAGMYNWYWGYLDQAQSHFLYTYTHDPWLGITNGSLGMVYLAQGREDLAAPRLAKATDLGYPNHRQVQASQYMMRGDFDAAFTELKIVLASPGADSSLLPWIYELEEAGRSYIENPALADALLSVVERAPGPGVARKAWLALLFNLKDQFFKYFSLSVEEREGYSWLAYLVPTLWLPEYREYIEDPRYFEIMRKDGAVDVWEQRGYLDGCIRVTDPTGDRLDCSQRYQ